MKNKWVAAALAGLVGWWGWSLVQDWAAARQDFQPDPWIAAGSRSGTWHFGGIERWVYPGMKTRDAIGLMEQSGYRCRLPEDARTGAAPAAGEHPVACAADAFWRSDVVLRVRYQPGQPPRLVSVVAAGPEEASGSREATVTDLTLRLAGLQPTPGAALNGWSARSPGELAALLHDRAFPDGWWQRCGHEGLASGDATCAVMLRDRAELQLKPRAPADPLVGGDGCSYAEALAELGFVPEAPKADAPREQHWQERAPLVLQERPDGSWRALSQWRGADLQGRPWRATLVLVPEGARLESLRLAVGDQAQEFAVAANRVQTRGCNRNGLVPQLMRAADGSTVHWLYWKHDTLIDDLFRWNRNAWLQAAPDERERIATAMVAQVRPAVRATQPKLGDIVAALYGIKGLAETGEMGLELEALERLQPAAAARQPLLPLAMALLRCGAWSVVHQGSEVLPDPACWREIETRAPSVASAGRQWLSAVLADPSQQPVYPGEKRLLPWLQALMLAPA